MSLLLLILFLESLTLERRGGDTCHFSIGEETFGFLFLFSLMWEEGVFLVHFFLGSTWRILELGGKLGQRGKA